MWRSVAIGIVLAVLLAGCGTSGQSESDRISSEVRASVADWKKIQRSDRALVRADLAFNREMSGCKLYTADCVIDAGGRVRRAVLDFASADRKAAHDVGLGPRCNELLRRGAAAADSVAAEYGKAIHASSDVRTTLAEANAYLDEAHRREAHWYALIRETTQACPTG